jgi:acyl dehydratase
VSTLPTAPLELAVGCEMPTSTIGPLTRTDFVRYAGAGGDFNAIHHDDELAKAAGMPTVFGMGMFHAGVLGVRLARWVGPENLRAYRLRFTGRVWPGDTLTFSGVVEQIEYGRAQIALSIRRQSGEQVLRATAEVVVAC